MSNANNLYLKCKTLLEVLAQDEQSRAFFGPMGDMADSAAAKTDQKFLQRLLKELKVISRDFSDRVTPKLLGNIGVVISDIRLEIADILERGNIKNVGQFRLINEYVDQIHQNPEMAPVVEALGKMLFAYEQTSRNRSVKKKEDGA